jgi:hypothetical protein
MTPPTVYNHDHYLAHGIGAPLTGNDNIDRKVRSGDRISRVRERDDGEHSLIKHLALAHNFYYQNQVVQADDH